MIETTQNTALQNTTSQNATSQNATPQNTTPQNIDPASQSPTVDCPECAAAVAVGPRPMVHEIVPCGECGAELELLSLEPLVAELAPEVEEDWGE